MKKIIIILFIAVNLLFLGACTKMSLDLTPNSSITDGNFWTSSEQFSSFIVGIHKQI